MRPIAWYRDVPQAYPGDVGDLPSLADQDTTSDESLRAVVARYLDGGAVIGRALGWGRDAFDPTNRTSLDTLTDGTWVWPGDAAHYCRTHGVLPAPELVEVAIATQGRCPEPDATTLESTEAAWFGSGAGQTTSTSGNGRPSGSSCA